MEILARLNSVYNIEVKQQQSVHGGRNIQMEMDGEFE